MKNERTDARSVHVQCVLLTLQRNQQKTNKIIVRTSLRDVTNSQTATKATPCKRYFVFGAELQLGNPAKAKRAKAKSLAGDVVYIVRKGKLRKSYNNSPIPTVTLQPK